MCKHLAILTNLALVCEKFHSPLLLLPLCTQHLSHWSLPGDSSRGKYSRAFTPSQNSEFCTITLPPKQANTQRMRLKIRSNPKVGDVGQLPIATLRSEVEWIFSHRYSLYTVSSICVRVGTRKSNSCSHSSSVRSNCSTKFKNTINLPQWIFVKTSEWRVFNLESLVPGRPQKASFSKTISLIGVIRFLARKR